MRSKIFATTILSLAVGGCGVFGSDDESDSGGGKTGSEFSGRVVPSNFKNTASGHKESFSMLSDSVNGMDGNLPHNRSKSLKGIQDTQVAFVRESSMNLLRDAVAKAESMQQFADYDWDQNPNYDPDRYGNDSDPEGIEQNLIGCKEIISNLDNISSQIKSYFNTMEDNLKLTASEEIPEAYADQIEKLEVDESDTAFHYVLKIDEEDLQEEFEDAKANIDGELMGGANETQAYTKFSGRIKGEMTGGGFEKSRSPRTQTQTYDLGAEFAVFIDTEKDLLKLGGGVDVALDENSMKFAGLVSLEGGKTPGVTYEFEASGDVGEESFDMESTTTFKMTSRNNLVLEQTLSGSAQGESVDVSLKATAEIDRFSRCKLVDVKCEGSEDICNQLD